AEWLSSPGAGPCRGSFAAGGKNASGVRWRYIITREEPVPDPSHLGRFAQRHAQSGWKNASAAFESDGDSEIRPGLGSRGAKDWDARARAPSAQERRTGSGASEPSSFRTSPPAAIAASRSLASGTSRVPEIEATTD